MSKYDPRKPRKNPEIADILRCIAKTHKALQAAPNKAQRLGNGRVLKAHLQMLEDEPEELVDLLEGTVEAKFLEGIELSTLTNRSPFEEAGECKALYFFWSGDQISNLYEPPVVDPIEIRTSSFYSCTLEKLYASTPETTHHFVSVEALRKATGEPKRGQDYWVLCDPRGLSGGRATLVRCYSSLSAAKKACDRFGAAYDVRFLVGRKLMEFSNR